MQQRDFGPLVELDDPAYIHPSVELFGKVSAAPGCSFWPYVVARAEVQEIIIGKNTNIQDFVMIHVGYDTPTIIGEYCSITHHVNIHGCTIGDNVLVGLNSTIMDGCVIGDNCIIAGGTFLKEGTVIPDNSIVMGTPGKVVKTRDCRSANRRNAILYHHNALAYSQGKHRAWSDEETMKIIAQAIADDA